MLFKKKSYPLKFLISGFEHSGTTLISEIMRQHPNLDSGFEGGILLCKNISDFENFEPFVTNFKNAWKITDDELADICLSKNYSKTFEKIREYSDVIPDKKTGLFDKTPRYLQQFSNVLSKVPDVPAVVIVRDMRSIIDSTFRRSNLEFDEWFDSTYSITLKHTLSYLKGLKLALNNKKLAKRILVIRYEELILNQESVARDMFQHLGYMFDEKYLHFNKVKYRHVYGNDIQDKFIYKYRETLNEETQLRIKKDFAGYENFFWE